MTAADQLQMFVPSGYELVKLAERSVALSQSHNSVADRQEIMGFLALCRHNRICAHRFEEHAFQAEMALQFESLAELTE